MRARSWQRLCDLGELKLEVIDGRLGPSRRQQVALLGVLLEVVGADMVIAVTGPRIWREALADAAKTSDDGGS